MKKTKEKTNSYATSIRRNIHYFCPIAFKKYPSYFFFNLLQILVNSFSPLINIYFPAMIVNELLNEKNITNIILYILIIVLGNSLVRLLLVFVNSKIRMINDLLQKYFSSQLNAKTMRIDYEDCENPMIKDLVEKAKRGMMNETNGLSESMNYICTIISSILTFISVFVIVVTSKMPILIGISFLSVIVSFFLTKKENNAQLKFWDENARLNRRFGYFFYRIMDFNFAKDLRLYHAESLVHDSSIKEVQDCANAYRKLSLTEGKIEEVEVLVIFILQKALVYFFLMDGCFKETITIATLTLLLNAFTSFNTSLTSIIRNSMYYKRTAGYQSKYIDYMEYESKRRVGTIIPQKEISSIEFRHVSFRYPRSEDYVLKDINLIIKNEKISLVGLNGAGKTTLIKLLCRFYEDYEGTILVNDIDIKEYDYEAYLKLFSVVFQDFKIISFTVKENVSSIEDNQEKLYDCFHRSGIESRINALPKKENTYVNKWFDKEGVEFSGGEMQKIAISRALYKDGPIVILDEPTSALDPLAEAEIYYRFHEVIGKKLTIFISHRLSSCRFANRIVVLDGKEIAEIGSHDELMKKSHGRYKEMFEAQAKYYQENKE